MQTVIALACAVMAAVCLSYAAYLQKRVLAFLPRVRFRLSIDVIRTFLRNKPWLIACGVMMLGSTFYGTALALAEVSIVAPIVSSGVALLAYLAIKRLGERPRGIDLAAIGLTIIGVSLIAVSTAEGMTGREGAAAPGYSPLSLWVVSGALFLLAVVIPLAMRAGAGDREAAGLGISVGLLYGMNSVFGRLLLVDWTSRFADAGLVALVTSPYLLPFLGVSVPGFVAFQAALQRGKAVIVVPIQTGLGQLVPILMGMLVMGEGFPQSGVLAALRVVGFLSVLVATIVLAQRSEETIAELAPVGGIPGGEETAASSIPSMAEAGASPSAE